MLRITIFVAAAAFVTGADVAYAQSREGLAPPAGATAIPPRTPVFTTEEKRANTYKTYPSGYAGCVEDLGYGRVKYGCGGE